MITNSVKSYQEEIPITATTSSGNFNQHLTQMIEGIPNIAPNIEFSLTEQKTTYIKDYKIDIPNGSEKKIFLKMQNGVPSTKDFLTLCIANNKKLAANKLDKMLNHAKKLNVFSWQIQLVDESDFSFAGKNEFDSNLNIPLAVAAKYDNTPICKVLVKHMQKKSIPLRFSIRSILTYNGTSKKYNRIMKQQEANHCYGALKKALKYDNIETAEYLYDIYNKYTKEGYNQYLVLEQLLDMLEIASTIPNVQFLLQKIDYLDRTNGQNSEFPFAETLGDRLLKTLLSSVEKNNWDLAAYIVSEHIDIVKNGTCVSQKIFLYEVLKNKKLDIARNFIKNVSIDFFREKEHYNAIGVFSNFTLLEIIKKDLGKATLNWVLANIG